MNLCEEMLKYRAKNKISQEKAASMAGVAKQTWYSIENGLQKPSKITEMKIKLVIEQEVKE